MSVGRDGKQLQSWHSKSHVSGKHSRRFAARIKDNLDKQAKLLEEELASDKKVAGGEKP